jgi:capsular exopolysaccharide synthesis family protein
MFRDPNSIEAEGYRSLRTALEFVLWPPDARQPTQTGSDTPVNGGDDALLRPLGDGPGKVVLVTSARPGEGKSSVAANLAVTAAQAGRNVVLIDGDLRKPQVHRSFAVRNDRGLSSILAGESTLSEAVTRLDAEKNLAVLPAGPPPPDPAELLLSDRLAKAIEALAKVSDLVVIDTPPVLPVTDATILAQQCDSVLLAATVGLSDRREWAETLERLAVVRANVIGTVLSRPDSRYDSTPTYHYAPTAAPANWWVTKATEVERERQPQPTDATEVMSRDSVDDLIGTASTTPRPRPAKESGPEFVSVDTINWAEDRPAHDDRRDGSQSGGHERRPDGGLERTGTSDGDSSDAAGDSDSPPL